MKKNVLHFDRETDYYAVFIRAKKCGKLLSLDTPELPEDTHFFTAQDVPNTNEFTVGKYRIPLFAETHVEYYEQAIGILVGKNKEYLYALQKEFVPSIAVDELNEVLLAEKNKSYNSAPLDTSGSCIASQFSVDPKHGYEAEPDSVFINCSNDQCTVHIVTQWGELIQNAISESTGLNKKDISVFSYNGAESLDTHIWFPALIASQVAVAAKLLKSSVFLRFSAYEQLYSTPKSPAVHIQHQTTLSKSNHIVSMHIDIALHTGSFHPLLTEQMNHMLNTVQSMYDLKNVSVRIRAYQSFSILTCFIKGWGDVYTTNALEKHFNDISQAYNLNPIHFRKTHLYKMKKKHSLQACDYTQEFDTLFQAALKYSDFQRKHTAYFLLNKATTSYRGAWRGIGLATGLQYNGIQHFPDFIQSYTVEITLENDNTVNVSTNILTREVKKILRNIISTELEIEKELIYFHEEVSNNSFQNRNALKSGSVSIALIPDLIHKCCNKIKKQRFRNPLPITVKQSYKQKSAQKMAEEYTFLSTTPAICVIELEADPILYGVKIRKIWLGLSPGKIYANRFVKNNVLKSMEQALSRISHERITVHAQAEHCINAAMYTLLPSTKMPHFDVLFFSEGKISRGIGEIPDNLMTAAYLSALNQIFINSPNKLNHIPVYIENIFSAFQNQEGTNEN